MGDPYAGNRDWDLQRVRDALSGHTPRLHDPSGDRLRRAAVAIVLRQGADDLDVLLIRRAERPGDPWSGHMAFPGGHLEPHDADLESAARRETAEEVGLRLPPGALIGALDEYPARARGRFTGMVVSPFVYAVDAPPPLRPNDEVAEVVWGPLGAIARGEVDAVRPYHHEGQTLDLPAYEVGGHLVWGMTHGMLGMLLSKLSD